MKRIQQAIAAAFGISLAGAAFAYVPVFVGGNYYDYARVARVDRVVAMVDQPQSSQQCWDQPRTQYHPGEQYRRNVIAPTYDEDGRVTGDQVVSSDVVQGGGYTTTEPQRVCQTRTAHLQSPQVVGYDVVYTYRGQDYVDRIDHDPGRSVRVHVENGYVELAE